jgi:EmrB/QacA subfamily drug resistance transporter
MSSSAAAETVAGFSRRIPLIVAAAFFMETLDGTIVTTALPAIAQSMHRPALGLTPGISVYLLAVAVFVPTAGWASDRFGARKLFAGAVALFTLASLLCAVSPSPSLFVAARAIQGAAAAFMSPVGRLVVLRETARQHLIEAIAILTWPALIGPVVGPPLAGLITTYASWRWIFLINVPIGMLGVWLVLRMVPEHRSPAVPRFDLPGFLLTAAALSTLIEGLTRAAEPGGNNARLGIRLILAGVLLGILAVRHALHRTAPMLDLRAVRVPSFAISTVTAGMLTRMAIQATPFLLPLMFEIGFAMPPLEAGMMLLIYMAGNLAMKSMTTPLLRRFGFARVLLVNGCLCALMIAACGTLSPGVARALTWATLLLAGMTRSMHFTTVNTLAFADIAPSERPGASTLSAMAQQLASTLGVAFAALALALSQHGRAVPALTLADFQHALWGAAALMLAATLWTLRLPRNIGAEVSGAA